jgi:DNA-binding TFAR19-related protein (PDSD5 family)
MKRQNAWQLKKRAEGMKIIRPLLTIEAQSALSRLQATRESMQAVVNEALIRLDEQERANAKLN